MIVRVPASSANLGPGFDVLGVALSMHLEAGVVPDGEEPPRTADGHPALDAFAKAGGTGNIWVRSPIPMGRGLGFSGAARVAGTLLALAQAAGGPAAVSTADLADEVYRRASELEGHGDNVAASLYGGVVVSSAGTVTRVPLAFDPAVVVWVPSAKTSTNESRTRLALTVPIDDVVFNLGRVAMLVAALASGDTGALRLATQDRLHQPTRLGTASASRDAIESALAAGAWCAWLSGSGPSVAALCAIEKAEAIAAALPHHEGVAVKQLRIDHAGAVIEPA